MLLASDILSDARQLLNDTSGVRYTDAVLIPMLNAVRGRLFAVRPDCVLQEDDEVLSGIDAPAQVTEDTDPVGIGDRFRQVLVDGLCALAYQIDDDDAAVNPRGRSAMHNALFNQGVMQV